MNHRWIGLALAILIGLMPPGLAGAGNVSAPASGALLDRDGAPVDIQALEAAGLYAGIDAVFGDRLAQGHTVRLTLDMPLQRAAQAALAEAIGRQGRTALGSVVVLDMQGNVLAMAGADRSGTEEGTVNHAIRTRAAPGEPFQLVTAIAGLYEGVLSPIEAISDEGAFDLYSMDRPARCWIDAGRVRYHANMTVVEGLSHSCYYFAYVVASRLGADGERLHDMAERLGLTGFTGIGLPGEMESIVGGQRTLYDPQAAVQTTEIPGGVRAALVALLGGLPDAQADDLGAAVDACAGEIMRQAVWLDTGYEYANWQAAFASAMRAHLRLPDAAIDAAMPKVLALTEEIRWGGTMTTEMAIGKSITRVTPVAMARCMAAVASGETRAVRLVDSVVSPEGEALRYGAPQGEAVAEAAFMEALAGYLPYIHQGFRGVVDRKGAAAKPFREWPYLMETAAMMGYGRDAEGKERDTWFVGFAPYDNPQIAIAVHVRDAGDPADVAAIGRDMLGTYLDRHLGYE